MKIHNTSNLDNITVNALVYGLSKAGKTRLISTAEAPLVLSIEDSLLSLAGLNIDVWSIKSIHDVAEAMALLNSKEIQAKYKTICIDSITELGEVLLAAYKDKYKDARQAYGEMADEIFRILRGIRALPFDCYVIAKTAKAQDITGATVFCPDLPGAKAAVKLPYFFDETFVVRKIIAEGEKEPRPFLQCQPDGMWEAGDKSGKLEMWEPYDLKYVFNKIRGEGAKEKLEIRGYVKELCVKIKEGRIEKQQAEDELEFLKGKSLEMGFPLSSNAIDYVNNLLK